MAVLVDKRLEIDDESSSVINSHLAWHETQPILAVAGFDQDKGGLVQVYYDDASKIAADIAPKSEVQVTDLAWHPTRKLLAISWENGELSLWNETDHSTYEAQSKHKKQVSILLWNEVGSILISADNAGACIGWKLDSQGTLSVLFHHHLNTAVTAIVLRASSKGEQGDEIVRLARAAVDGDEKALNAFTNWAPSGARGSPSTKEFLDLFVGSEAGTVFYISDSGSFTDVLQVEGTVLHLLHYAAKDFLIVVTETLSLIQYKILEDGSLTEHSKMKLSGQTVNISVIWGGPETLAVSAGEKTVRLWNIENGQNWVLSLEGDSFKFSETITCIAYEKKKSVLGAGTSHGHVVTWKFSSAKSNFHFGQKTTIQEDEWQGKPPLEVHGSVQSLGWGTTKNLLGVITATDGYIVTEHQMCYAFSKWIAAIQIASRHVTVDVLTQNCVIDIKTEFHIENVFLGKDHVVLLDGKKLMFYELDTKDKTAEVVSTFNTDSEMAVLLDENVFVLEDNSIQVRNQQGLLKQSLASLDEEGTPCYMNLCDTFMTVVYSVGFVKVWDVGKQGIKVHAGPKTLSSLQKDNCIVESAKCNCSGNKVSIVTTRNGSRGSGINMPTLYIWDLENGSIASFDFQTGKFSTDEKSGNVPTVVETPDTICGRYPLSHFWDEEDPRLLVCTLKLLPSLPSDRTITERKGRMKRSSSSQTFELERKSTVIVVTFFVTSEYALKIQDIFPLQEDQTNILGVTIPYYYVLNKQSRDKEPSSSASADASSMSSGFVSRLTMRDFYGLEECDKVTRDAIMDFSFYLTTGNMDEAFRSIKMIRNETVWENMARMCVKTKRLDVAIVCLGKMGHARGAKALREANSIPELDARVAILAVQLGMTTEAERLLKVSGRYDLLNRLYQDSGQWSKSLEVAEHLDRIHRRSSYYNYAKYLESKGDIAAAIAMYEKSDTHHFEVPHMLFDEPRALESYIMKNKDKDMLRWWAQYMESVGEMETALQFYEMSNDYLSLVRVYCFCNNLEKAAEIANETGDRAACFHLGRQFENRDNVDEAVHFFTRARAFNNAIRICKEQGMEDQLLNLALMGGPEKMVDVARYYENQPEHRGKAAMLYHKAGFITKAVEMAFKNNELDALQHIAVDLNKNTDPEILTKCAEFFVQSGQYATAVDLLATAGKHMAALELASEKGIMLSEELAEKLTMGKDEDQALRAKVLDKIGEICMRQENYHLAAKKFTQAGNKVQAMKALLKSGDTEKIVFFAGVSRQKEIYIMSANYLQSLDWRQDPEIMKHIISFYTKGKALESLAAFYDACAQVEIDEYQNYEKALGALGEAFKCLSKFPGVQDGQKLQQLQVKMEFLKRFVQARRLFESNQEEGITQLQALLQDRGVEVAIRRGDIYGFIVEQYARKENYKNAYAVIEEMRERIQGVNLAYYITPDILRAIYTALNVKPIGQNNFSLLDKGQDGDANTSDNEVEEDFMVAENGF